MERGVATPQVVADFDSALAEVERDLAGLDQPEHGTHLALCYLDSMADLLALPRHVPGAALCELYWRGGTALAVDDPANPLVETFLEQAVAVCDPLPVEKVPPSLAARLLTAELSIRTSPRARLVVAPMPEGTMLSMDGVQWDAGEHTVLPGLHLETTWLPGAGPVARWHEVPPGWEEAVRWQPPPLAPPEPERWAALTPTPQRTPTAEGPWMATVTSVAGTARGGLLVGAAGELAWHPGPRSPGVVGRLGGLAPTRPVILDDGRAVALTGVALVGVRVRPMVGPLVLPLTAGVQVEPRLAVGPALSVGVASSRGALRPGFEVQARQDLLSATVAEGTALSGLVGLSWVP